MKKTIKISLILLCVICMTMSVYAASCSMSLKTSKNEFSKNDKVVVDVAISSISDVGEGIIGIGATLEYDKNNLSLEKMEGQNGWGTPTYNEENGIFVMDRNALVNTPETILKMTFKVKDQKNGNATITLKDITASGGEQTGDIAISNITKTITIKGGTSSSENNVNKVTNTNDSGVINNNNNPNQAQNPSTSTEGNRNIVANTNNNNMMQNGSLPKAGAGSVILIVLGVALGFAIVSYIKMKKID